MRPAGPGLRRMLGVAAPVPSPWGLARAPAKHGVWSRYRMLVFFLKKIQKEKCKFLLAYFSGCAYTRLRYGGSSSVGRAPGCGPGGRGFKSHLSPHKEIPPLSSGVFLFLPPGYLSGKGPALTPMAVVGSPGTDEPLLLSRAQGRAGMASSFLGGRRAPLSAAGTRPVWKKAKGPSVTGWRALPYGGNGPCGLRTGRPCQSRAFCVQNIPSRSVAQHGSAPALGAGGRWFESSRSDHKKIKRSYHYVV